MRASLPRLAMAIAILLHQLASDVAVASDKAALRRGLQVHVEVCGACHGIGNLRFTDLSRPGGPELTGAEVEELAGRFQVPIGRDARNRREYRPANADDTMPAPFATPAEARQIFAGMLPVDLATLGRSGLTDEQRRQLIADLLLGYREPQAGLNLPPDRYFNIAAPGQSTGMPPPLADGMVDYGDPALNTVDHYARDVADFLVWAARVAGERR